MGKGRWILTIGRETFEQKSPREGGDIKQQHVTQVETYFILNGLLVTNHACPEGSCIKFAEKSWYCVGWPNIGMGVPDNWYRAEQKAILWSSRLLCKRAQEAKEEGEKKYEERSWRGGVSFLLSCALVGRGYVPSAAKAIPPFAANFF